MAVGLAGGIAGGKGAIAAKSFVERGPVLWGETGSTVGDAVAGEVAKTTKIVDDASTVGTPAWKARPGQVGLFSK